MASKSPQALPNHLGLILDGNRRWAKSHGLPTLEGHRKGAEVFKNIAPLAFKKGIKYLSAFVFSTENWSRTQEEVGYLMKLVIKATEQYLTSFNKAGIKIKVIGNREGLPKDVLKAIEKTEERTNNNTKGCLTLCFNYGGQEEILNAAKQLLKEKADPEKLSLEQFEQKLYSKDIPPLDLIVRTSGEQRLSGFLLYHSAYSELFFIDKHWPDFNESDLDKILSDYADRERRFGS